MARRRRSLAPKTLALRGASLAAALLAIFALLTSARFLLNRTYLPYGTTVSGVPVADFTVDEALQVSEFALAAPVTVTYAGRSAIFDPRAHGFTLDSAQLLPQLEAIINLHGSLPALADRLMLKPRATESLVAVVTLDDAKICAFLMQLAAEVDQPMTAAKLDPDTLKISAGQPGSALNLDDSRKAVRDAVARPAERNVTLAPDTVPPQALTVRDLDTAIRARVQSFVETPGNIAGVYVKDLDSGDEFSLNGDVAFSAPGWLRWGIALEHVRSAGTVESATLSAFISGDETPNVALTQIGSGDSEAGSIRVNETLRALGLVNTFVAQPYGRSSRPPTVVTPANARGDITANPDPNTQSTPVEIGLLLEMLDQCRNQSGSLMLAFEKQLTPSRCAALLDMFGQARLNALIETTSPQATVIQRTSGDDNTHGAAGLVRSNGRTYVVVVAVYSKTKLDWANTSVLIGEVSRAAFALFHTTAPPPSTAIGTAPKP